MRVFTHVVLLMRRYQEFKAALEGLDPKRQSVSPLPIIYQWQQPMGGPGTKCAPAQLAGISACLGFVFECNRLVVCVQQGLCAGVSILCIHVLLCLLARCGCVADACARVQI